MQRLSFTTALVLALALGCGSAASAARMSGSETRPLRGPEATLGSPSIERGIVQSVSVGALVLRTLDGSTITVAVDAGTRVRLNDKPASILAIRPGFVVVVTAHGRAPLTIDAYGAALAPSHVRPLVGTIRSLSNDSLVLAVAGRADSIFAVDPDTRIFVAGKPSPAAQLAPGDVAVVRPASSRSRTAYELDGFPPSHAHGGTIASVTAKTLVVRVRPRGLLRFRLPGASGIFLNGAPAAAARLHSGLVVVVRATPRRQVWAFGTG